jgi:hypothetical protein
MLPLLGFLNFFGWSGFRTLTVDKVFSLLAFICYSFPLCHSPGPTRAAGMWWLWLICVCMRHFLQCPTSLPMSSPATFCDAVVSTQFDSHATSSRVSLDWVIIRRVAPGSLGGSRFLAIRVESLPYPLSPNPQMKGHTWASSSDHSTVWCEVTHLLTQPRPFDGVRYSC